MPQLDKVTFLSQFFWLCFFYIGFYFLILKFFLPKMSLVLKLRKNKLTGSQDNVNNLQQENQKIRTNYETLFTNALTTSKAAFNKSFQRIEKWLHNTVESTEKKHYQSLNKTYISSVGENSLSQNLAFTQFTPEVSKRIYVYALLKTLEKISNNTAISKTSNASGKKK